MTENEFASVGRYRIGDWIVEPALNRLSRGEATITIEPKMMQVLACLAQRAGEVLTRRELMDTVWATEFISENILTRAIAELRNALGDNAKAPTYIETIHRSGYRMIAPVELVKEGRAKHGVGGPGSTSRWPHFLAIAIAIAIALLVILPPEALFEKVSGEVETGHIRSIAILPFENLTGDTAQDFFVDGLHDQMIATFAQISGFKKVTSRMTVMRFRDSEASIREIGDLLGVESVLEGSVRRSGSTVVTTVSLVDTHTESLLWGESFERELTDVLDLQNEVARKVVDGLDFALNPDERELLGSGRDVDADAYDAYLKGSQALRRALLEDDYAEAIGHFNYAIRKDPDYAEPHIGLSTALRELSQRYRPPGEVMPQALSSARRALELDDRSAEAHAVLGTIRSVWQWDWDGAEKEFKRALELSPNNISTLRDYSTHLAKMGRFDEAIAAADRALEIDPLNSTSLSRRGWVLYYARRFDDGIDHLLRTIEVDPGNYLAHFFLSWLYWGNGQNEEALAALERAGTLHPAFIDDPFYITCLAVFQGCAGGPDETAVHLQSLIESSERRYVPPRFVGVIFASMGEKDLAIEWLERAFETRDSHLANVRVSPTDDSLRDDPRFQEILRRMDYPEH